MDLERDNEHFNKSKEKEMPILIWEPLPSEVFPCTISPRHLSCMCPYVEGSFNYSVSLGTKLDAGQHVISCNFIPSDLDAYSLITLSNTLSILKAVPIIEWKVPPSMYEGEMLSKTQLNAHIVGAHIKGIFEYMPPVGSFLKVGKHTLIVNFVPDDSINYGAISQGVDLEIIPKLIPVLLWSPYSAAVHPCVFNSDYFTATSNCPGIFSYSYANSSCVKMHMKLSAGSHRIECLFVPEDTIMFSTVNATNTLEVLKAAPQLRWSSPPPIFVGEFLSYDLHLNAKLSDVFAHVSGKFYYTPNSDVLLPVGNHFLEVLFTPDDHENYDSVNFCVEIMVNEKVTPAIQWAVPQHLVYPTPLSEVQLNASVPECDGTLSYSIVPLEIEVSQSDHKDAGTSSLHNKVLAAGRHLLLCSFTPTDTWKYNTSSRTMLLEVKKCALPALHWQRPPCMYAGELLDSSAHLNARFIYPQHEFEANAKDGTVTIQQSPVAGTFSYSPPAGSALPAGHHSLHVEFQPHDPSYETVEAVTSVTVRMRPIIEWEPPPAMVYGRYLRESMFRASCAQCSGIFEYLMPLSCTDGANINDNSSYKDNIDNSNITDNLGSDGKGEGEGEGDDNDGAGDWESIATHAVTLDSSVPSLYDREPSFLAELTDGTGRADSDVDCDAEGNSASDGGLGWLSAAASRGYFLETDLTAALRRRPDSAAQTSFAFIVDGRIGTTEWAAEELAKDCPDVGVTVARGEELTADKKQLSGAGVNFADVWKTLNPLQIGKHQHSARIVDEFDTNVSRSFIIFQSANTPIGEAESVEVSSPNKSGITLSNTPTESFDVGQTNRRVAPQLRLPVGTYRLHCRFTPSDQSIFDEAFSAVDVVVEPRAPTVTWPPTQVYYDIAVTDENVLVARVEWLRLHRNFKCVGNLGGSTQGTKLHGASHVENLIGLGLMEGRSIKGERDASSIREGIDMIYKPVLRGELSRAVSIGEGESKGGNDCAEVMGVGEEEGEGKGVSNDMEDADEVMRCDGVVSYSVASGWLPTHTGDFTLVATFTPTDTINFSRVSFESVCTVKPLQVELAWEQPGRLLYGVPLTDRELCARIIFPHEDRLPSFFGVMQYSVDDGTILAAGEHEIMATFVPARLDVFLVAHISTTITVEKYTPCIVWNVPKPVTFGSFLTKRQLNARIAQPPLPREFLELYGDSDGITEANGDSDNEIYATDIQVDVGDHRIHDENNISGISERLLGHISAGRLSQKRGSTAKSGREKSLRQPSPNTNFGSGKFSQHTNHRQAPFVISPQSSSPASSQSVQQYFSPSKSPSPSSPLAATMKSIFSPKSPKIPKSPFRPVSPGPGFKYQPPPLSPQNAAPTSWSPQQPTPLSILYGPLDDPQLARLAAPPGSAPLMHQPLFRSPYPTGGRPSSSPSGRGIPLLFLKAGAAHPRPLGPIAKEYVPPPLLDSFPLMAYLKLPFLPATAATATATAPSTLVDLVSLPPKNVCTSQLEDGDLNEADIVVGQPQLEDESEHEQENEYGHDRTAERGLVVDATSALSSETLGHIAASSIIKADDQYYDSTTHAPPNAITASSKRPRHPYDKIQGHFIYDPPPQQQLLEVGEIMLGLTFRPDDCSNFEEVHEEVRLQVVPVKPILSWLDTNPATPVTKVTRFTDRRGSPLPTHGSRTVPYLRANIQQHRQTANKTRDLSTYTPSSVSSIYVGQPLKQEHYRVQLECGASSAIDAAAYGSLTFYPPVGSKLSVGRHTLWAHFQPHPEFRAAFDTNECRISRSIDIKPPPFDMAELPRLLAGQAK